MRWNVHGERSIYRSEWVSLTLCDVELPSGARFEHHVVRMPCHAAGVVVDDPERGILLIWRHRFTTDTWGYEIPAGRIDEGETALEAAHRETAEETGWAPGELTPVVTYHPLNGSSDATFHVFRASSAEPTGQPHDQDEVERVVWLDRRSVRAAINDGNVRDGMSLTALLWHLADMSDQETSQ
jgi:8-oxo-dGDP phosphatase